MSIDQGVIRWERPPPVEASHRRRGRGRPWALVSFQLQQNPGKWGLLDDDSTPGLASTTSRINSGDFRWFRPAGAFVATQRTVDGRLYVYAVYIGENHEYAERAGVECVDHSH